MTGLQVAMCNFNSVGDAAAVAIATMHSGIQVFHTSHTPRPSITVLVKFMLLYRKGGMYNMAKYNNISTWCWLINMSLASQLSASSSVIFGSVLRSSY